jgi:transcriptional regulator with XRE-family HTH domain
MAAPRDPQSLVALVTSPKAIGLVVRKARTAEGLSLREAAQRCGVGPRFLRELENGKPSVRLDKVLAVMAEFGLMALVLPAEALQGVKF